MSAQTAAIPAKADAIPDLRKKARASARTNRWFAQIPACIGHPAHPSTVRPCNDPRASERRASMLMSKKRLSAIHAIPYPGTTSENTFMEGNSKATPKTTTGSSRYRPRSMACLGGTIGRDMLQDYFPRADFSTGDASGDDVITNPCSKSFFTTAVTSSALTRLIRCGNDLSWSKPRP